MDKFTTSSTSSHTQKVIDPIIIEENNTTRRVFLAEINDTKTECGETVSGTLMHQRKSSKGEWENIESINLNSLKSGDGVKLKLRSSQLKKLYDNLTKLYALSQKGVSYGQTQYVIGTSDEIITVSNQRKKYIEKLLEANHGKEIWEELVEFHPDLATKLAFARIQNNRNEALIEFQNSISDISKDEAYWQAFFTNNDWIFGYGLNYKFLTIESDQPNYGGENYKGVGKQKGDYLTHTESQSIKFTVLVEIKKPTSALLAIKPKAQENVRYRNGAWLLGSEVLGGVSQLQINCKSWQKSAEELKNNALLSANIYTVKPKGILIIGNTSEFRNEIEKITSFELFRQSLNDIEIITYDELLERAKFIIGNQDSLIKQPEEDAIDELPF